MPVVTVNKTNALKVDDDLTDLSWLVQMNNKKCCSPSPTNNRHLNEKNETIILGKRASKPFAIVNGNSIRSVSHSSSSSLSSSLPVHQYSNEENRLFSRSTTNFETAKRKFDSSIVHHQAAKRFHSEQILPIYPSPPESLYFTPHQRSSMPTAPPSYSSSRYMLLKNDPSLSDTMAIPSLPTMPLQKCANLNDSVKMIEHSSVYSDDIEQLLDIFKNEVDMMRLDPTTTTTTTLGECTIDMPQCLSSDDFCPY